MSAPDGVLRLLLIEDNPGDARLIREMLREAGGARYTVEAAARLGDGLERLAAGNYDALLLDLSLPDAAGLETFRRAREQAPHLPIVVLSGLADEALALRAVQAGAQDYLIKGQVDGPLLARAIRYAVQRQCADAERLRLLASERAARARAERLASERAAILGQIADGVVIANPDGDVTYLNEAAQRMLGYRADELPAAPEWPMRDADGRPFGAGERPLVRAVRRGETLAGLDMQVHHRDGRVTIAEGSAAPVDAEDGRRLGAVLTLRDVTAQRDLERQKDEFLANVSHDLRTPVTAIKISIGVVLANEPPGLTEPLRRMLVNINLATDRMARLVADLLDLTRLRAGRLRLERSPCDLVALARRSAQEIEPLARERGQRLELDLPAVPLTAWVDAEKLERALLNLLGNAQKYGREGGLIGLRLERSGDAACFAVQDDGPGIPAAEQALIFERFYRSGAEAGRRTMGSGLGLAIARAMVELHGGHIGLRSRPGEGATFRIAVPLGPPDDRDAEAEAEAET